MTRVLVLLALLLPLSLRAQERVLNVYNWTDYIDPAALERFKKETGVTVHYDVYDSLETLEAKMLTGHSGYDIIVPTAEPALSRLIGSGALLPLDKAKIPNLAGLDPALVKRVATSDPGNKYAAIYLWGTIGLGEIPSKLKALSPDAPLDSWDLLFKPENAKRVAGCGITMMDSATDVIPSVLRYLHHSPDSADPKDLADVERTLMAIRPYIRTFAAGGAVEALAAGESCLVFDYSGDVIQASGRAAEAKRDPVTYVAPREFTQLWFDTLAVPKDAPHPELAFQFINFLLQPDVIAGITNTVHYPNAVPASRSKIDANIQSDPNVYPPPEALARSFTVSAVSQAANRARTRMWARFKAGS
jgi:putrescine transport system substrate-binding protein